MKNKNASFKFFKHKDGISSFAEIAVGCVSSSEFAVRWNDDLTLHERLYGPPVLEGIADAIRWHQEAGGESAEFIITSLTDLVVDTKADAVRCAATAAAWKVLGHSEAELEFEFEGMWRVKKKA